MKVGPACGVSAGRETGGLIASALDFHGVLKFGTRPVWCQL